MAQVDHLICFKGKFYRKHFKEQGNCSRCAIKVDSEDCKFLENYCSNGSFLKEVKLGVKATVV